MTVLNRICRITGKPFEISEAEQEHVRRLNEVMPQLRGEIPLPEIHPVEAMRRACSHGNYFFLFRGKSVFSGKAQLTRYHPSLHSKISSSAEFWSDQIDNTAIGRDYDFSRSFFEQLEEVFDDSYLLPLIQINCEGSDYVNGAKYVRNSYLCFDILESEDCLYCFAHYNGHDNTCCVLSRGSSYCYECLNIDNCYECQHSTDCINCSGCFACFDCIGCHDCFACTGLRNLRYHVYNEHVGKDGYQDFLRRCTLGDYDSRLEQLKRCRDFVDSTGHRPNYFVNTEDCSGNYLRDSSSAFHCYFAHSLKDCGHLVNSKNSNNCWRGMAIDSEFSYESVPVGSSRDLYSYANIGGEANVYSFGLEQNSSYCFGCAALKKKSYCILNKQYSREEYFELVPRIVAQMKSTGEWGQGLPPGLSQHISKHTLSNIFFEELPEEEKLARGYRCENITIEPAPGSPTDFAELPNDVTQITENQILGRAFPSQKSGRLFNIQGRELAFHKRFNIPLPRLHWYERIEELWTQRERIVERF